MREQVKWTMVGSAREVCGSVRLGGNNPKSIWWNNEVKAEVRGKEVLAASIEEAKERYGSLQRREMLKAVYISAKRK